ncbi:ComF family protein [Cyclobacterium jeungdonense]|uniref:Phosphoribosyltransferase family protein n=1 Tax=Cyclobacterium jeungdonense TaxID=708087 RepID=A0ABT8C5H0_9BACT|nr:phosphoribosyltransferase family protein [Cyclobacterium jeungdonense]MDN3687617.1 phosphoribosyltransferase family protein [Cyclobacterium jeungdonense]
MRFNYWQDFLSLVFPETCCICKRSLFPFEDQLCKICISRLPLTDYHLLPENNDLKTKVLGLAPVDKVMAYLRFSKSGMSQKILHQIKYKNKPALARLLGQMYGTLLKENGYQETWDLIVPVPLHQKKYRLRGYNQSEELAKGLASALEITPANLLLRMVPTQSQTNKSRMERWENVSDVFSVVDPGMVINKKIVIVDDVMTTGATLAACAQTLQAFHPQSIDLAVLAAGK